MAGKDVSSTPLDARELRQPRGDDGDIRATVWRVRFELGLLLSRRQTVGARGRS